MKWNTREAGTKENKMANRGLGDCGGNLILSAADSAGRGAYLSAIVSIAGSGAPTKWDFLEFGDSVFPWLFLSLLLTRSDN